MTNDSFMSLFRIRTDNNEGCCDIDSEQMGSEAYPAPPPSALRVTLGGVVQKPRLGR